MNHIYRVVWNQYNKVWQAVCETAKGKTKSSKSLTSQSVIKPALGLIILSTVLVGQAIAAPTGGVVTAGTATIGTSGTTTTINQSTAKAAIDWSSFSTASTDTVNFVQPNSSSITLNRVIGSSASTFNGKLNANGQVFIINPNGVLFGTTSQVNTGGLVASTLNLSNTDFLNSNFNFANATNNKTVENRGKITVPTGGTVALIAPSIKQTGTITTPEGSTLLAAGSDVTLTLNNGSLVSYTINQGKAQALINSGGLIKADGGKVILTAQGVDELSQAVVNHVGVIEAKTVGTKRGVIELGSDMASGTVTVSGKLDASAPTTGNGGFIKTTASNVEVSGGAVVTTRRVNQASLPPTTSGWELTANSVNIDLFSGVSSTALGNALDNGNVTLKAVGTETEQGNISINDTTSWGANTALTLTAAQDINFNNELSLSGDKAKLAMNFGSGHDYNLNDGAKVNITGALPTLLINGTAYTVINELGEEGDASVTTLQGMNNNLTGNYALGSDIDASETVNWNDGAGFDPIGYVTVTNDITDLTAAYSGKFHGLGHSIDNLNINVPALTYTEILTTNTIAPKGLFGLVNGDLRDIGITNSSISGYSFVGSLVGLQTGGIIKNAYSSGSVNGFSYVGGLVGVFGDLFHPTSSTSTGNLINSYSTSDVKGMSAVGGLAGVSLNPIYNSYATGNISLPELTMSIQDEQNIDPNYLGGMFGGGLVGLGRGVYNSYATGNVIKGTNVNGNWHGELGFYSAGGLIGMLSILESNQYVDNNYATGNIEGITSIGGLVGGTAAGSNNTPKLHITNSYATGNVTGEDSVGGLVGTTSTGKIVSNSYSSGTITGVTKVGGLVGNNGGIINNSYSTSNIIGDTRVGGLVGDNGSGAWSGNGGTIDNSYSSGSVTGITDVGGLVGFQGAGTSAITNSYWNTETSGQLTSVGGTGKTTAEMQQIATFSGWDIADISDPLSTSVWVIDEDSDSPKLRQTN